jgi:hypothetical protein
MKEIYGITKMEKSLQPMQEYWPQMFQITQAQWIKYADISLNIFKFGIHGQAPNITLS